MHLAVSAKIEIALLGYIVLLILMAKFLRGKVLLTQIHFMER